VKVKKRPASLPQKYQSFSNTLADELGTKVQLKKDNKGKGSIVISFSSDQEFERIAAKLSK